MDDLGDNVAVTEDGVAKDSGYICYFVDGAEAKLSTDALDSLTEKDLKELTGRKSVNTPDNHCGKGYPIFKVVHNSKWYLVYYLDNESAAKYYEGDTVNIDYVGKLDGVAFEGGSDTEFDLTIGSESFIEDFEKGLIGKTVGTTVDVDATFPEDYRNEDLAGKTVVFTITIHYVGTKKDEADDDYIRRLSRGTYKSAAESKEKLREMMEDTKKKEYEDGLYDSVIKQMIEISDFKTILDEDVAFYEDDMKSYYESYAGYYGKDVKDFVTEIGYSSYDAFLAECHENAVKYVKEYMVLEAVAEKEGITVSPEVFDERVQGYMESAYSTDKKAFIEEYSVDYLNYCILNDLSLEFLVEKAKQN